MRRSSCLTLLALAGFLAIASAPGGSRAQGGEEAQGDTASPVSTAAAAGPRDTDSVPVEPPRSERAGEPARARPPEALMRALMVISSAGGGRPFPLVPR